MLGHVVVNEAAIMMMDSDSLHCHSSLLVNTNIKHALNFMTWSISLC